jgi:hypothetical protein
LQFFVTFFCFNQFGNKTITIEFYSINLHQ